MLVTVVIHEVTKQCVLIENRIDIFVQAGSTLETIKLISELMYSWHQPPATLTFVQSYARSTASIMLVTVVINKRYETNLPSSPVTANRLLLDSPWAYLL